MVKFQSNLMFEETLLVKMDLLLLLAGAIRLENHCAMEVPVVLPIHWHFQLALPVVFPLEVPGENRL